MMDNGLEQYTSKEAIQEAVNTFNTAVQKCPSSLITFGGYRFVQQLMIINEQGRRIS
jgi:hypothetical protein